MIFGWCKPEYVYAPRQALRRLSHVLVSGPSAPFFETRLPWGMPIRARSGEAHGKALRELGVVDLAVTEVLWRLTDAGEVVADVGANIGCMTAVLASRVGPSGTVWAFEAHPAVFEELCGNAARWTTPIHAENVAVWRTAGTVSLETPPGFETNRGLARISAGANDALQVPARMLDDYFPGGALSVLKLDVEGHELAVLEGAARLLAAGRLRDCVFEEHREPPTPVTEHLRNRGYEIFRIARAFRGVRLLPLDSREPRSSWEPTSFLATREAGRARKRLAPRGWQCLGGRP